VPDFEEGVVSSYAPPVLLLLQTQFSKREERSGFENRKKEREDTIPGFRKKGNG
jgi:hypothetical protein